MYPQARIPGRVFLSVKTCIVLHFLKKQLCKLSFYLVLFRLTLFEVPCPQRIHVSLLGPSPFLPVMLEYRKCQKIVGVIKILIDRLAESILGAVKISDLKKQSAKKVISAGNR